MIRLPIPKFRKVVKLNLLIVFQASPWEKAIPYKEENVFKIISSKFLTFNLQGPIKILEASQLSPLKVSEETSLSLKAFTSKYFLLPLNHT